MHRYALSKYACTASTVIISCAMAVMWWCDRSAQQTLQQLTQSFAGWTRPSLFWPTCSARLLARPMQVLRCIEGKSEC